ncbi:hypothetical protein ACWEPZ_03835 [Streptomyces sp. NPDC004288]
MPARKKSPPPPAPAESATCGTCEGTGETSTVVRVGRKRRGIGAQQTGLCPDCLGTGTT